MIEYSATEKLKRYLQYTGTTQEKIAALLGISQAQVSQILNGKAPSAKALRKITTDLVLPSELKQDQKMFDKPQNVNKFIKNFKKDGLSISTFSSSYSEKSGDFLILDELVKNKKMLIVGDSVGHGQSANDMSFAIEYGYYCASSMLEKSLLNASLVKKVLEKAYYTTENRWVGPPSILYAVLNRKQETNFYTIELINSGLPSHMVSGSTDDAKNGDSENKFSLKAGSSLFIFTDGFVNFFDTPEDLRNSFLRISKVFKGDSEAILLNLLKSSKKLGSDQKVDLAFQKDDMTALIISKIKD